MQITRVRIRKFKVQQGQMYASASITFDDEFAVHDLRIIGGSKGLFVSMPSRKGSDGNYRDVAHPVTAEMRRAIQDAVLKAYQETEAGQANGGAAEAEASPEVETEALAQAEAS